MKTKKSLRVLKRKEVLEREEKENLNKVQTKLPPQIMYCTVNLL